MSTEKQVIDNNDDTNNQNNKSEIKQSNNSTEIKAVPAQAMLATAGLENLDKSDFEIPRIKLLQNTSNEVNDGVGEAGNWINTLSYETYGDALIFTPITLWKSRILFDGGDVVCRSADAMESVDGHLCAETECPFNAMSWGADRTPPDCTLQYNYLILPDKESMPSIVTLSKTSFSAGRALNTLLVAARAALWDFKYELRATKRSNKFGTYYIATAKKCIVGSEPVETTSEEREKSEYFYQMWTAKKDQLKDNLEDVPFK